MSGLGKHSQYSDLLWAGWSEDWIPVGTRRDFLHPSRADLRPPPSLLYNRYHVFPGG